MTTQNKGGACAFSAISGFIYENEKPASGAKVLRTADWKQVLTDEAMTDEKGYFEFPAMYASDRLAILPSEFVVSQTLEVLHGAEKIKIWDGVKRSKEEGSESKGNDIKLRVELSDELKLHLVSGRGIFVRGEWDVKLDEEQSIDDILGL